MLPAILPHARTWIYQYNSNCCSDGAQEVDILGLGQVLLDILWSNGINGTRPILFIGSCFGGIVVAQVSLATISFQLSELYIRKHGLTISIELQAIVRASRYRKYAAFLDSIAGVVFLGTPLRGTSVASIARWLVWLRGILGKETSKTLLKALESQESSLDAIVQEFAEISMKRSLRLRCFYETRETRIANTVLTGWIANRFPKIMVRLYQLLKDVRLSDERVSIPYPVDKFHMPYFKDFASSTPIITSRNTRLQGLSTHFHMPSLKLVSIHLEPLSSGATQLRISIALLSTLPCLNLEWMNS